MITTISEIRGDNINWNVVGARLREFRTSKNLDTTTAAEQIGYEGHSLNQIENGKNRKCVNIIFRISQAWDLSLNWLLNGIGKYHDPDPVGLIPPTLITYSGAGITRDESKRDGAEGQYSDRAMEFVIAVDKYKQINQVPFPSNTQIFDIVLALGYRKCVSSRIAPLGYFIDQQEQSEQLNQISETLPRTNLLAEYAERETANDIKQCDERIRTANNETEKFRKQFWERVATERAKRAEKKIKELMKILFEERQKVKPAETLKGISKPKVVKKTQKPPSHPEIRSSRLRRSSNDTFRLIDPQGDFYVTTDLIKFCDEHYLDAVKMFELAYSSDSQKHDGWKSEVIKD